MVDNGAELMVAYGVAQAASLIVVGPNGDTIEDPTKNSLF